MNLIEQCQKRAIWAGWKISPAVWLRLCLLLGLAGLGHGAQAQTPLLSQPLDSLRVLRGTVLDSAGGAPIGGATVMVKGRKVGVATDARGQFSLLLAPGKYSLAISYLGYATFDFPIEEDDFAQGDDFYSSPSFLLLSGMKMAKDIVAATGREVPVAKRDTFSLVKVFFATDRTRGLVTGPVTAFTNGRSAMRYGTALVSIPGLHKAGEIEQSTFNKTNPYANVLLRRTDLLGSNAFFAQLATRVEASSKSAAFLFVHGYNVTFADAALRTAQMHYDLKFPGVPTFFSWPSQGSLTPYVVDEQNAEWAQDDFKEFLRSFLTRTSARQVYIIAHSMGSRPVMHAVRELLVEHPELAPKIQELILAAPDFDAEVFKRNVAPVLERSHIRTTLYSSSQDRALLLSKQIHGHYSRLGLVENSGPHIVRGMETIVASDADPVAFGLNFGLGHSYFADVPLVLTDLGALIVGQRRPDQRTSLTKVTLAGSQYYWNLAPRR